MNNALPIPRFLVIGGMKCATTTMHQDLTGHPRVFCGKKELNALTFGGSKLHNLGTTEEIYARNYRDADPKMILGDVSTTYTMLPDYEGVAEKARSLLGEQLKIVYVVRHPVKRTVSHHQHMANQPHENKMGPDINQEIRNRPALIDYSCYHKQLLPWVNAFGRANIRIVKFERYVKNRNQVANELFEFLGLDSHNIKADDAGANRSGDVLVAGGMVRRFYDTNFFKSIVQPLTPNFLRTAGRSLMLKKSELAKIPPSSATINFIADSVSEDLELFYQLVEKDAFKWDLLA